jgi:hypothetical protein
MGLWILNLTRFLNANGFPLRLKTLQKHADPRREESRVILLLQIEPQ